MSKLIKIDLPSSVVQLSPERKVTSFPPPQPSGSSEMSCLSADRAFGLFVGAELEKLDEFDKKAKKSKIMELLWQ